jgi:hypothetical protein
MSSATPTTRRKLFNLQEVGWIYSRLTNPTVAALANRVVALEGGAGGIACSSGHAAQIMALFPLMGPGKNIVASTRLYGGTITQFSQTIKRFGWSAKFVDTDDLGAVEPGPCDKNTRAIFCETIANPGGYVTDIPALAKIADRKGIPADRRQHHRHPLAVQADRDGRDAGRPFRHQIPDRQRHRHRRHRGRFGQVRLVRTTSSPPCPSPNPPTTAWSSTPRWAAWPSPSTPSPSACATWA